MREQNMTSLNRLSLRIRESLRNRIGAGLRSAFRRSGLVLSLCLAGISGLAEAGAVTVDARGRDQATAETNARLNATREVMNAMAGPEFVKSQMKRIRAEIIARPEDFTGKVSILKQQKSGKNLLLRAEVTVDNERLAEVLRAMGAEITDSGVQPSRELGSFGAGGEPPEGSPVQAASGPEGFFGSGTRAFPGSVSVPAIDNTDPVTEILVPGFELNAGSWAPAVRSPGERFTVFIRKPQYTEVSRKIAVIITAAGTPFEYEASLKASMTNEPYYMKADYDFYQVRAPVLPGSYEIRVFSTDEGRIFPLGRLGYQVTGADSVTFRLDRDTFVPGEEFFVTINGVRAASGGRIYLVADTPEALKTRFRDVKSLDRTKPVDDLSAPHTGSWIKAPKEEGDYLLVYYRDCRDCSYHEHYGSAITGVSYIKIRVKAPGAAPAQDRPRILVPERIYAGSGFNFLADWPGRTDAPRGELRIKKKGRKDQHWGQRVTFNPGTQSYAVNPIFSPGEYIASAESEAGGKKVTSEIAFRVEPSLHSADKAVITPEHDSIEPDTGLVITGTSVVEAEESSFVILVPRGTPEEVTSLLKKYGDKRQNVGHRIKFSVYYKTADMTPGNYEARLYSSADPYGRVLAKSPVRVLTPEEIAANEASLLKELNEPVSGLSEEDSLNKMKDRINREFYMPGSQKAGANTAGVWEVDYGKGLKSCAVPGLMAASSGAEDLRRLYDALFGADFYPTPADGYSLSFVPGDYGGISDGISTGISDASGDYRFMKTKTTLADCSEDLDEQINKMSRLDITLGREGNLDAAIMEFGTAIFQNYQFATDLGKVRDAITMAQETCEHTLAVMDSISEKDMESLAKNAMKLVLNSALKICNDGSCLENMILKDPESLKARLTTLPKEQYEKIENSLRNCPEGSMARLFASDMMKVREHIELPDADFLKLYERAQKNEGKTLAFLDEVKTLRDTYKRTMTEYKVMEKSFSTAEDLGTEFGRAWEGSTDLDIYGNAALTLLSLDPNFAMAVATVKLGYQASLASRDFINDTSIQRVYGYWKVLGDDDRDDTWKNDGEHTRSALAQAKKTMSKTLRNEMTQMALNGPNRRTANAFVSYVRKGGDMDNPAVELKPEDISDEEAFKYLRLQFQVWQKTEERNSDFKSELRDWAKDFQNLNTPDYPRCESDFRHWHAGNVYQKRYYNSDGSRRGAMEVTKEGIGRFFSNWDGCEAEVAAFKEYAETRVRLEDELIQWGSGTNNNRCSQKTMKKKAKELMCLFVDGSDGPKHYKTEVAYIGCECGWDNFDADGKLHTDFKRAKKMREREVEIVARALGHNDLMSCLCNSSAGRDNSGAAMGVGLIYHDKPGSKKSECGGVGGCWAHGYGCWHYPMPTDGKSLDSCGYYRYVRDHKAEAALRRKGLKKDRECYMGL